MKLFGMSMIDLMLVLAIVVLFFVSIFPLVSVLAAVAGLVFVAVFSIWSIIYIIVEYYYLAKYYKKNPDPQRDIEPLLPPTLSDKLASHELRARLLIGKVILLSMFFYYLTARLLHWTTGFGVYWMCLAIVIIIGLDWWLLRFRVKQGWYGSNAMEAAEIVKFIENRNRDGNNGDSDRILPKWKPIVNKGTVVTPKDRMAI